MEPRNEQDAAHLKHSRTTMFDRFIRMQRDRTKTLKELMDQGRSKEDADIMVDKTLEYLQYLFTTYKDWQ